MLRASASEILSRYLLDMRVDFPWIWGKGDADKILIWNKGLHSYYVRHGASPELMEVTGHPVDDRIGNFMAHQHENRNHLVQRHQLDGSNKIVIFNYPPSHHTSQDPSEITWAFLHFMSCVKLYLHCCHRCSRLK